MTVMKPELQPTTSQFDTAALAAELRQYHSTSPDERAMVAHVSNKFRINKKASRPIVESYLNGFREGADSVFSSPEVATPSSKLDAMFAAAFHLARAETEVYLHNQRSKLHRDIRTVALAVPVMIGVIAWLLYNWLSR